MIKRLKKEEEKLPKYERKEIGTMNLDEIARKAKSILSIIPSIISTKLLFENKL